MPGRSQATGAKGARRQPRALTDRIQGYRSWQLNRRLQMTQPPVLAAILLSTALAVPALAQDAPLADLTAPFSLPDLPYEAGALAPTIDEETMTLHRERHQQTFVDNLNAAAEADPAIAELTLGEMLAQASTLPPVARNSGGGHWNHTFFWPTMAPAGEGGEPSEELAAAIDGVYGSMDAMQEEFNTAAAARFGSGWAWLIVNEAGELAITTTPNQDNPLMDVADVQGTPLLGNDVWEHAYYLTYNNRRADYLDAWWDVVNWDTVSERYAEALADL